MPGNEPLWRKKESSNPLLPLHKALERFILKRFIRDVLGYKSKRDASRRKNLDDLALAEYEEGLYEKSLNDSDT